MENSTINSRTLCCKWLIRLLLVVFFFSDFQMLQAQCTAPVATSTPSSQTICSGTSPTIILSSNIPGTTFSWTVVQNGVSGGDNFSLITSQILSATGTNAGTAVYTVTPSANGCFGSPITVTITVMGAVSGGTIATAQTICNGGDPAAFTESAPSTGSGTLTYAWKASTDGYSATHATSTTYDIPSGLTATTTYRRITTNTLNGLSCTVNSNDIIVTVISKPTVLTVNQTLCPPATADLTSPSIVVGSTGGLLYSYYTDALATIPYATPTEAPVGIYYIVGVAVGGCSDTTPVNVTVNPGPIATGSPSPQSICDCSTTSVALSSNIPGTTFSWTVIQTDVTGASPGTGSSIAQTLCRTGSVAGTAIYTITPTANGCVGNTINDTVTIDIDAASFSYPSATHCQTGTNPTPTITGLAGGVFSSSPAGLQINSSTGIIDLATSSLGTYSVTYTTNGICPNTNSITMTITIAPSASISYPGSPFCKNVNNPFPTFGSGASAGTFSATPTGLVFVNVNTGEIDLSASLPGTYTITNTIPSNGGCAVAIATTTVTINSMDDAAFVYSSGTYCTSGTNPSPTITGLPGGTFSSVPAGLSIDPSTGTISLSTSSLGAYTLTYTTNGNCPNTNSSTSTVIATPSANFGYPDTSYCQNANNPFPIFGSGSSAGVFSSAPAGLVFVHINTGEIDIPLSAMGTYTVTNTIPANGGCAGTISTTSVTINSVDDASFTYPFATYCQAGTNPIPTITGVSGGLFSAIPIGLSIDTLTGTINLATSVLGAYTVLYSINGPCQNSGSVNITITNVPPSADFSYSDSIFCKNESNPSPIYGSGAVAGLFSAIPTGLVFANNTGKINLYASATGTYTITNTIPANGGCASTSATTTIHLLGNCAISGYIFKDNNTNCIIDSGDQRVNYIPLKFYDNNNNFIGIRYSNSIGAYQFLAPLGTYTVKIDTAFRPYTAQCLYPGIDTIVTLTGGNPFATNVNFEIGCKPGFDIGVGWVGASGAVFPGVQHKLRIGAGDMSQMNWYWYWSGINCPSAIGGQVQITVTGPVTYNEPSWGALTPSVSGNVFTYSIADFDQINNWQDFGLLFITDTSAQLGDQICVNVVVTPTIGDNNVSNNTYNFCYVVGNSFDPNMKEVYPVNVAPAYQDWFTYTIHFQNTGNAPAMNIRLADTLDANLDFETFQLMNYSDSIEVSLDNNLLNFRFPNIMLPDSTSDPEGSKGYVQYRVKPKANLPAGTQIKNTAFIYFDYNSPIVTNTTINEFVEPASISEIKSSGTLSVYPNPGNGKFKIQMDNGQLSMDNYQLAIYNVLGEKIFQSEIKNLKTEIDISHQPNGIYIIRVNDGIQSLNQRLIKQ